MHVKDPLVRFARVDVGPAEYYQIEEGWVGKLAALVGGLVEGQSGIWGDGTDGSFVGGPDGGKQTGTI